MWKRSCMALALGLTLCLSTTHAITLDLSPASLSVLQGDPVTVEIVIAGLGDFAAPFLGTFDMNVNFDPAILSFSAVVFGALLGDPDTDPDPSVSDSLETEIAVDTGTSGIVNLFALSLLEGEGPPNCVFCIPPFLDELQPASFTLATLTFDTIATTTTPSLLTLSVLSLGDANADTLLPLTAVPGTSAITVSPRQPGEVPEPSTITLLGTGFIVFLCYAGRQRYRTTL